MKGWIAAGAALAGLAGAMVALKKAPPRPELPIVRRVSWPENRRYLYSFSLREAGQQRDGELALQRAGGLVALSYSGQTAFLNIDMRGQIRAISFLPETSAEARGDLGAIALHLGYSLPLTNEPRWEAEEVNALGLLRSRYRSEGQHLVREALEWKSLQQFPGEVKGAQQLMGGAAIALDAEEVPLSIEEALQSSYTPPGEPRAAVLQRWTFTLRRKGETPADPALNAALALARPQTLYPPAEEKLLLTLPEVVLTLDEGKPPERDFVHRAALFLRQHPEQIPEVSRHFDGRRALVLDVLAETGVSTAQQSMRMLLSNPELRQRFAPHLALLADPDVQSVKFVKSAFQERPSPRLAAAMGSMIRRLAQQARGSAAS
jgi:hypothetical protein